MKILNTFWHLDVNFGTQINVDIVGKKINK